MRSSYRYVNIISQTTAAGGTLPPNFTLDDIPDGSYYGRVALSELTTSGLLKDHTLCVDGSKVTLTFPDTLIKSSFMPVVTKTTVTGVTITCESGTGGSSFNYNEFYDYLLDQGMTISGVTPDAMASYINNYFTGPGVDNAIVDIYINGDLMTFSGTSTRGEHTTLIDGNLYGSLIIDGGEG
jgi:hypothetical protein